jgi:hypothetical protein
MYIHVLNAIIVLTDVMLRQQEGGRSWDHKFVSLCELDISSLYNVSNINFQTFFLLAGANADILNAVGLFHVRST